MDYEISKNNNSSKIVVKRKAYGFYVLEFNNHHTIIRSSLLIRDRQYRSFKIFISG